jgi:photosystem II stability/assembly factor-like uncharacterized protein
MMEKFSRGFLKCFQKSYRPIDLRPFLLLAVLLLTLLTPSPAAGQDPPPDERVYLPLILQAGDVEPPQLLLNPSFEADPASIQPWQWLTSQVDYRLQDNPALARHGRQYLAANRQDQANGKKSLYQEINAPQAGHTYHFAIWVRASDEAVSAGRPRLGRIDLSAYGGAAPREHSTHNFAVTDPAWHCVETALTVTGSGHLYLRAEVYLTSLDNFDYHLDHAILRDDGQATCPPPPLVDGSTLISDGQGFDTCAAPAVAALNAWDQASPYDYFGLYLGGANHYPACKNYNQQYQTPAWFAAVDQQEWAYLPIWVGPQPPCTSYTTRFSDDPGLARLQGIEEARQAIDAARTLGLISPARQSSIIYFDMEPYPTTNLPCHQAANAFLGGWVSELQSQGHKAGIYGSVHAVNSWYSLEHVPDSVWVAWYIRTGYDPAMTIDPVNQTWIVESYWDNHRLYQYSNSHNETWGGATINIDNDAARGLVALEAPAAAPPLIQAAQLVANGQGWLWLGRRLFWTGDGGSTWQDMTPAGVTEIKDFFFHDADYGWLLSAAGPNLDLSRTSDGGRTWQTVPLNVLTPDQAGPAMSAFDLHFIDPQTGWLAVKLASGASFSRGLLFKTEDGGQSWQPLASPAGQPVHFVTAELGWTTGGPTHSELYLSQDGGQSWQAQDVVPAGRYPVYQLPVFTTKDEGMLSVTVTQPDGNWLEVYTTSNGGRSWRLAERIELQQTLALGTRLPVGVIDAQRRLVAEPALTPGLPAGVVAFDFAGETGWAYTRRQSCVNGCRSESRLFSTADAGQSWAEIQLP